MAEVSRTARVIQNAKVALFFYCINLILQFFSRKIFLDYLGAELLGLNTTAQNLLQFLNLAESGIGAAVAFALYKPLSQKNRQEIIDIVSLQGWFYRWVGLFVIAGSIVLMAFFPWIFAKANVPLIYAYGTFIAFLISALLGYFVNYKMIVLSADQKEYKITFRTQSIKIIKIFLQIFVVSVLQHGYFWWIMLEVIAAIIQSILLNVCINREYPWLVTDLSKGRFLRTKYLFLLKKVRQLFFHKIGGFVLGQSTPLVIFALTNLTTVAIYGNYLVIMGGCLALVEAFSRSLNASVGNLVSERNSYVIKQIFWKIHTMKLFLAGGIASGIFTMSESFIELWVGKEYVMSPISLMVMTASFYIQMTRTSDIFLSAYGLFKDTWAPMAESLLNLGLSVLFGYFWELPGILVGVLISQVIIVNSWKVYFLYREGFKETSLLEYVLAYSKKLSLVLLSLIFTYCISQLVWGNVSSYSAWLVKATGVVLLYTCIGGLFFFLGDSIFRKCLNELFSKFL